MARTLEQGFSKFLEWLQPLDSERSKAKSHKDSVKSCMATNFKCHSFFETGSFGAGTGVRHYSDTDYFAACPNDEFWSSSGTTLRKVKEALQYTFWNTAGIVVRSPAVRIPFGNYRSENLEVTPSVFKGLEDTSVGKHPIYEIADGNDGWMFSSPSAHNAYVKKEDERLEGKLKPLIQFIKAWKFYNNVPIKSFYLELRVAKYAAAESSIIYDIDIYRIMRMLYDNDLASMRDPIGIAGLILPCDTQVKKQDALSKLNTGHRRASKAYDNRDNADEAFYWWNLFFNGQFPSR